MNSIRVLKAWISIGICGNTTAVLRTGRIFAQRRGSCRGPCTFICTLSKDAAGPTINWEDPFVMRRRLKQLFKGCMRGLLPV